ncbi:pentapeptide repeat-containing protein [Desulfovibrio inopinatus]|uniref:pentapeptide repeat-containing protein n=1 Tax=Desulfovibrio inopinatus TaxID=102109 RepID=UPI0003FE680B|nr:pentapeptide repeat-containing protein [Desulfovibrio inopinatus]
MVMPFVKKITRPYVILAIAIALYMALYFAFPAYEITVRNYIIQQFVETWTVLSKFLRKTETGSADIPNAELLQKICLAAAGFLGLSFAYSRAMSHDSQARTANEQTRIAEQGLITDRFIKATEQLGSEKETIRIGGIYSLWRIAVDSTSESDKIAVLDTLAAFVRASGEDNTTDEFQDEQEEEEEIKEDGDEIQKDIQAVMNLFAYRMKELKYKKKYKLDLSSAKLPFAKLQGSKFPDNITVNFENTNLKGAILEGANLKKANLRRAILNETNLLCTNLREADLWLARLSSAKLGGTNLRKANLERAMLCDTDLSKADLRGTNLKKAILYRADLRGRKLKEADLQGAELDHAILDDVDFSKVKTLQSANFTRVNKDGTPYPEELLEFVQSKGATIVEEGKEKTLLRLMTCSP